MMNSPKYQPRDDDEAQAARDIQVMLDRTRPQGLFHGVTSGVGYILGGALGACGIVVLSPFVGAKQGHEKSGSFVGAAAGGVKGAVSGVVHAVNVSSKIDARLSTSRSDDFAELSIGCSRWGSRWCRSNFAWRSYHAHGRGGAYAWQVVEQQRGAMGTNQSTRRS
jgi:hypothetical protein